MDGYHGLWVGTLAPSTMFYSEYQNYGPDSSTKNRVKWKGVETINLQVASKFTVNKFVQKEQVGFGLRCTLPTWPLPISLSLSFSFGGVGNKFVLQLCGENDAFPSNLVYAFFLINVFVKLRNKIYR